MLTCDLSLTQWDALEALAEACGHTATEAGREGVMAYLDRMALLARPIPPLPSVGSRMRLAWRLLCGRVPRGVRRSIAAWGEGP